MSLTIVFVVVTMIPQEYYAIHRAPFLACNKGQKKKSNQDEEDEEEERAIERIYPQNHGLDVQKQKQKQQILKDALNEQVSLNKTPQAGAGRGLW